MKKMKKTARELELEFIKTAKLLLKHGYAPDFPPLPGTWHESLLKHSLSGPAEEYIGAFTVRIGDRVDAVQLDDPDAEIFRGVKIISFVKSVVDFRPSYPKTSMPCPGFIGRCESGLEKVFSLSEITKMDVATVCRKKGN